MEPHRAGLTDQRLKDAFILFDENSDGSITTEAGSEGHRIVEGHRKRVIAL